MRWLISMVWVLLVAPNVGAFYDYYKIDHMLTQNSLVDVDWHPDGSYALIIESSGKVIKLDPSDWSVSQVAQIPDFRSNQIAFNPDGSEALVVGYPSGGDLSRCIYRWDHALQSMDNYLSCPQSGIELRGIDFLPDASLAIITGWYSVPNSGVIRVWEYSPADQSLTAKAAANFWGPSDVSWAPDGSHALIPISQNSAEVAIYYPGAASEYMLVETPSFSGSNAYGTDHHPTEGYGIVVDGAEIAHKWDGINWTEVDLGGGSLSAVAFNTDGTRALLVGRTRCVYGDCTGRVYEFNSTSGGYSAADFSDVSIPGFDLTWGAESSTYLNAVSFRPGLCEGLMVGSHPTYANRFAPMVHFVDIRGADCLQPPSDGGIPDGTEDGSDDGEDGQVDGGDAEDGGADGGDEEPDGQDGGDEDPDGQDDGGDEVADDGDGEADADGDGGSTVLPCLSDGDCPPGSFCDGANCMSECRSNYDCLAPFVCSDRGRCVPPGDEDGSDGEADGGVDDGQDGQSDGDQADGGDSGDPNPSDQPACIVCQYDSQCTGRYCSDGCCIADCFFDSECPSGYTCGPTGRCRELSQAVSDCACGAGGASQAPALLLICLIFGVWHRRK